MRFGLKGNNFSSDLRNIFRSLQYPNFRLFFSGQCVSLVGTWMQKIALPWYVFDVTGSALLLGIVSFATQAPVFLVSPFAGVLADRWNRYRSLILTQTFAMVQAIILFLLVFKGFEALWPILFISIVSGVINAFDIPIRQSFFVQMVEKRDDLCNAIAMNSTIVNIAKFLGPSIAGIVIATSGASICFLINAVSYVFVITTLLFVKPGKFIKGKKQKNIMGELREGLVYVKGNIPIKHILLLLGIISLMGISYAVLMPVFVNEVLQGGPELYGFLMASTGFGALIGAIYLASRSSATGLEKIIPYCALLFGLSLIIFACSRNIVLSMVIMVFTGMGTMLLLGSANTVIQTTVEEKFRGRVMGLYSMCFMGIAPFGSLLSGFIATYSGTPFTLFIGGLACVAGGIYYFSKLPDISSLIQVRLKV